MTKILRLLMILAFSMMIAGGAFAGKSPGSGEVGEGHGPTAFPGGPAGENPPIGGKWEGDFGAGEGTEGEQEWQPGFDGDDREDEYPGAKNPER